VKKLLKNIKQPKPHFFSRLAKALIAFGIWFLFFSLIYVNMRLGLISPPDKGLFLLGTGLLLALLITAGGSYLYLLDYKSFSKNKNLILVAVMSLLSAVLFEICIIAPLNPHLFPAAGIGMLLAILLNLRASFVVMLCLTLIFGMLIQARLDYFLTLLFGSGLAIILTRNSRRRNQILSAGMLVGIINFITITCMGFVEGLAFHSFLREAGWGFASGILSSFLVMGLLPLFEIAFNITTNVTLLELSDLNHPLLKELILKAPGTYHHSLIVGNLAEAACASVSANSLLARVGAYYHDIGKIEKPEYFSENEIAIKSRHEKLLPTMSALVITNHVKNGKELAKRHKLPKSIIEFIEQHHGTGLIYYFYQRALEKVKDESLLKEEDYRYAGPKPQSKETAIVLLADAVEASSRTLSDPTPAKLKALTQRIINNKFIDGQLDDCELSLKDLHLIAESFSKILTGLFHSRVEYPGKSNISA